VYLIKVILYHSLKRITNRKRKFSSLKKSLFRLPAFPIILHVDAASVATQIGSTINDVAATVANGVFSVNPDFGAAAFSGGNRYLEVAVRRTSNEAYMTLTPGQKINSASYGTRTVETTNFSSIVAGDVSGTQNATIVNKVGGESSTNIRQY
jgi:hypothetical protein